MKLPVHCFVHTDAEARFVENIKLEGSFEWKCHVMNHGEWLPQTATASAHRLFRHSPPATLITIGPNPSAFAAFNPLPFTLVRSKWMHFNSVGEIDVKKIAQSYFHLNIRHPGRADSPLVSFCTSAFRSGDKIMRPFLSLVAQTYTNWEWVIVVDAEQDDEKDQTWKQISGLAERDCRIRVVRASCHDGYIGSMKLMAFSLGRGELLVEFDHDDGVPKDTALELVLAMKSHPECVFFFSDFKEKIEGKPMEDPETYPASAAQGFCAYIKVFDPETQCYHSRYVTQYCNPQTITHIVGYPNHLRAWRRKFYHSIGGHNPNLAVGDDYELGLRTFLAFGPDAGMCHLHESLYDQYRNTGGNNHTLIRNALIQDMVGMVFEGYKTEIEAKFTELKIPFAPLSTAMTTSPSSSLSSSAESKRELPLIEYECDGFKYPRIEKVWKPTKDTTISIVMPTWRRPVLLDRAIQSVLAQTWTNWELYVIGDCCPEIEGVMQRYKDTRIMWWNLPKNYGPGGSTARNYFHRICPTTWTAMLDDDNTWDPNHLSSLWDKAMGTPDVSFVWSSMKINGKPIMFKQFAKGRIDTSCILFKSDLIRKYGFWKDRDRGGYSHDFELFNRWYCGGEKWAVTGLPTCNYNCDTNGQTYESILLMVPGDQ